MTAGRSRKTPGAAAREPAAGCGPSPQSIPSSGSSTSTPATRRPTRRFGAQGDQPLHQLAARPQLQTGKLAWYYQAIHHEVWDFDLVTGPILFDVTAGADDQGRGFGREELLPVPLIVTPGGRSTRWSRPVPTMTDVPGEEIWPTQPFPYTAKGVPMQPFCATFPMTSNPELAKRARQMYTHIDQGGVHFVARRVELRLAGLQSANEPVVRDREERGHFVQGPAGGRQPAPGPGGQHWTRGIDRRGTFPGQRCRRAEPGDRDGLPSRHGRTGVADRVPDDVEHRQLGELRDGRQSRLPGQRAPASSMRSTPEPAGNSSPTRRRGAFAQVR